MDWQYACLRWTRGAEGTIDSDAQYVSFDAAPGDAASMDRYQDCSCRDRFRKDAAIDDADEKEEDRWYACSFSDYVWKI